MHAIALWCTNDDVPINMMNVELTEVATGVYEAELPNSPGLSRLQVAVTYDCIMSLFHTNIDPLLPPFLFYLPQPWGSYVYPNQTVVLSANGSEDVEEKVTMAFAKMMQGEKNAYHFAADEHVTTADCPKPSEQMEWHSTLNQPPSKVKCTIDDHEESKVHNDDKGGEDDEESDDDMEEEEDGATEDDTEDDTEDGTMDDTEDDTEDDEDGIDATTKKALIADCICNDNVK